MLGIETITLELIMLTWLSNTISFMCNPQLSTGFEFICAQSPYSMRGFLIGLFYCIYGLFIGISGLVLLIFAKAFQHHKYADHLSCGSYYYLTTTAVAVLGTVIYFVAARWYRRRQRGGQEFVNERAILESYYENAVHADVNMNL